MVTGITVINTMAATIKPQVNLGGFLYINDAKDNVNNKKPKNTEPMVMNICVLDTAGLPNTC